MTHGVRVQQIASLRVERASVREELAFGADDLLIGTVANFRTQKDYPNLLQAARELVALGSPARFVVVGHGPLEHEIRSLCTSLDLDGRIVFTGKRRDAVRLMAGMDVFVLASRWEGMPIALMEALALGLPVVATKVGGTAEVLTSSAAAILVPPGNPVALAESLHLVLTDSELRKRMSLAAGMESERFDIGSVAMHLEGIYASLTSEPEE